MNSMDLKPEVIAQTDNFVAWKVDEPDGETTYHLDINNITVHFFVEEWESFLSFKNLFPAIEKDKIGTLAENDDYYLASEKMETGESIYNLEVIGATLYLFADDWAEFKQLVQDL